MSERMPRADRGEARRPVGGGIAARLCALLVTAILCLVSEPAGAQPCERRLTGTWIRSGDGVYLTIVEKEGGELDAVSYRPGSHDTSTANFFHGSRGGDELILGLTSLPFPYYIFAVTKGCDVLDGYTVLASSPNRGPFRVERISDGYCGDSRLSPDEECDDGNLSDLDACLLTCALKNPPPRRLPLLGERQISPSGRPAPRVRRVPVR